MLNRVKIAKHWLMGNKNNVTFSDLCRVVFSPSSTRMAKQLIKSVERKDDLYEVTIEGINHPVYWPAHSPIYNLYVCIREICFSNDWHYYEKPLTELKPNDVVADCGVGEGLFSLRAAEKCEHVFAFEPLPSFLRSLKQTFSPLNNVTLIPKGLSDKTGVAFISDRDTWSQLSTIGGDDRVELMSLDSFFFEQGQKVDYIKADVEGYEPALVRGALRTIKEYRPRLSITTYHDRVHAEQLSEMILGVVPSYRIELIGVKPDNGAPILMHAACR